MRNYKRYIQKIDSMLAQPAQKQKVPASGLLSPSRVTQQAKEDTSVDGQVAKYISVIRQQKQEILRGK